MNVSHAASAPRDRPVLILKVGQTHDAIRARLGDFDDWIAAGLRQGGAHTVTLDPRHGTTLPEPSTLAGIVVSGSHAMVSDREPWSEALLPWVRQAVASRTPFLGICYGHQLLAHAFGGEVAHHPDGVEIGTVTVRQEAAAQNDPLFAQLPSAFDALSVHWQSVRRLPEGAVWPCQQRPRTAPRLPHRRQRLGRAVPPGIFGGGLAGLPGWPRPSAGARGARCRSTGGRFESHP